MKRAVFLLMAAVSLSGCDRPDNSANSASYNPKYDGVASQAPSIDPAILEPQKQAAPTATPAAAAPAATAPAASPPASQPSTEPAPAETAPATAPVA